MCLVWPSLVLCIEQNKIKCYCSSSISSRWSRCCNPNGAITASLPQKSISCRPPHLRFAHPATEKLFGYCLYTSIFLKWVLVGHPVPFTALLSYIIIYYDLLSYIIIYCHILSHIIMVFRIFFWIFSILTQPKNCQKTAWGGPDPARPRSFVERPIGEAASPSWFCHGWSRFPGFVFFRTMT